MVTADADLAWAAGLTIGEGSFFNTGGHFRFAIAMYDERAIRHFAEIVQPHLNQQSSIYVNTTRTGGTNYRFGASGFAAVCIGQLLAPWLRCSDKWDQFMSRAREAGFDPLGEVNLRGRARFSPREARDLLTRYEVGDVTQKELGRQHGTTRECVVRTLRYARTNRSVLASL